MSQLDEDLGGTNTETPHREPKGESMRREFILGLVLLQPLICQTRQAPAKPKPASYKINTCVEEVPAHGSYVRFTTEEHLQILLNERTARNVQDLPYRSWENASRHINWFDGEKPVSLAYVKSHMPRAMLLELRFPVGQNPHIVQDDIDWLLKTEKAYNEAAKVIEDGTAYLRGLLTKYDIGPSAIFDDDMGGVRPEGGCAKWEEKEIQIPVDKAVSKGARK